jgi:hypothetical protein
MITARWRFPTLPIPPGRAIPVVSKELIAAEIARKRAAPRARNASAPVTGEQTDQRETSAGEESGGGAFCQLDSGGCEMVKRLRDPSLTSPVFKRIATIAVSEPNLLATRLEETGVEPRLALAIAAALMRERKDPPVGCKVCRAMAACASTARARERAHGSSLAAAAPQASPDEAAVGARRRNHKLDKKERV